MEPEGSGGQFVASASIPLTETWTTRDITRSIETWDHSQVVETSYSMTRDARGAIARDVERASARGCTSAS
jgi:hypothetical protein